MSKAPFNATDYPIAERRSADVTGARGRGLDELMLDAVLSGEVGIEDLRITPGALLAQAEIARAAGRDRLAENFERAAEMTMLPAGEVMEIYDLLRPGRAQDAAPLLDWARRLREEFDSPRLAEFVEEAAAVYERRGLFRVRF
jgi:propanediol dehydratase small subunit